MHTRSASKRMRLNESTKAEPSAEMDPNLSSRAPCFCKTVSEYCLKGAGPCCWMQVPPEFVRNYLPHVVPGMYTVLQNAGGETWPVKYVADQGFVDGWAEFATGNELAIGDTLVFSFLETKMDFVVQVFDRSGCEKGTRQQHRDLSPPASRRDHHPMQAETHQILLSGSTQGFPMCIVEKGTQQGRELSPPASTPDHHPAQAEACQIKLSELPQGVPISIVEKGTRQRSDLPPPASTPDHHPMQAETRQILLSGPTQGVPMYIVKKGTRQRHELPPASTPDHHPAQAEACQIKLSELPQGVPISIVENGTRRRCVLPPPASTPDHRPVQADARQNMLSELPQRVPVEVSYIEVIVY